SLFTSLPVSGHFLLIGSAANETLTTFPASDFFSSFLNSLTFSMYFSGSFSNFALHFSQQKPISCFLYSNDWAASTSLPDSGHFTLMALPSAFFSSFFSSFFSAGSLNSATLAMYLAGSA